MENAAYWIEKLAMEPLPEGGHFKESWRSEGKIPNPQIGYPGEGDRNFGTSIYYLMEAGEFAAFHRQKGDEVWHFHAGGPLTLYLIDSASGKLSQLHLGLDIDAGQRPQQVVPANCWFAARPIAGVRYSLSGCTMAPGFDYRDFEIGNRAELISQFPHLAQIIEELTS